jgi:hypothetical protein
MEKKSNFKKAKKVVDFIANSSSEAMDLKNLISNNNFEVNHIFTGSTIPIIKDAGYYVAGSSNIRILYTSSNGPVKAISLSTVEK